MSIFSQLSHYFSKLQKPAKGFTLIELLVVSLIIIVLTTFILFQQAKFNSATLLRSLTYSIALSVRQAQTYGTSVRGFTPSGGGETFSQGYGVYVPSAGTSATAYYIFSDINNNGRYDPGEELPAFNLGKGYVINALQAVPTGQSAATAVSTLTIYFRRPNPDACFATTGACTSDTESAYSAGYIQVRSTGNNETRSIKVASTGQITVCAPNLTTLTQC